MLPQQTKVTKLNRFLLLSALLKVPHISENVDAMSYDDTERITDMIHEARIKLFLNVQSEW